METSLTSKGISIGFIDTESNEFYDSIFFEGFDPTHKERVVRLFENGVSILKIQLISIIHYYSKMKKLPLTRYQIMEEFEKRFGSPLSSSTADENLAKLVHVHQIIDSINVTKVEGNECMEKKGRPPYLYYDLGLKVYLKRRFNKKDSKYGLYKPKAEKKQ